MFSIQSAMWAIRCQLSTDVFKNFQRELRKNIFFQFLNCFFSLFILFKIKLDWLFDDLKNRIKINKDTFY